jgi:hypothetical protein
LRIGEKDGPFSGGLRMGRMEAHTLAADYVYVHAADRFMAHQGPYYNKKSKTIIT